MCLDRGWVALSCGDRDIYPCLVGMTANALAAPFLEQGKEHFQETAMQVSTSPASGTMESQSTEAQVELQCLRGAEWPSGAALQALLWWQLRLWWRKGFERPDG